MDITFIKNKKPIIVYVDGSNSKPGKKISDSGVGIVFPNNEFPSISSETKSAIKFLISDYNFDNFKPTNNIAELIAILSALFILELSLKKGCHIVIKSDSMYSINSLTKWYKNWIKNGWVNAQKKPVANKDIIKYLLDKYIIKYKNQIIFQHVKAHTSEPPKNSIYYNDWFYNNQADYLSRNYKN